MDGWIKTCTLLLIWVSGVQAYYSNIHHRWFCVLELWEDQMWMCDPFDFCRQKWAAQMIQEGDITNTYTLEFTTV